MQSRFAVLGALSLSAIAAFAIQDTRLLAQSGGETPEPAPIDVGIVVGSTDLFAHNFSTQTQILFFRAGEFSTWRVLAPGATFTSTYTRQAIEGVKLEVASYDGTSGLWRTSRGFDLATLADASVDAVWIQDGPQPPSWLDVGTTLTPTTTEPSTLPPSMPTNTTNEAAPTMQPLHVPVVTPVDRDGGDRPPVLDERPLPPA